MSTTNINYASPSATLGRAPTPGAPDRKSIHATITTQPGVVTHRQMRLEQDLEAVAPPPAPEPPTPPTPTFILPASVVG